MLKAVDEATTNKLTAYRELLPEQIEYVGADEVLISLKTNTGDLVTFTLKTAALMQLTNLSVNLINGFTAQVLRDLDLL